MPIQTQVTVQLSGVDLAPHFGSSSRDVLRLTFEPNTSASEERACASCGRHSNDTHRFFVKFNGMLLHDGYINLPESLDAQGAAIKMLIQKRASDWADVLRDRKVEENSRSTGVSSTGG